MPVKGFPLVMLYIFSTLLQKHCNKKQETQKCILKLCGWKYPQGTYTPLWGVSALLLKTCDKNKKFGECIEIRSLK